MRHLQVSLHWENDVFCEFLAEIISAVFFCICIFLNQLFRSLNTAEL